MSNPFHGIPLDDGGPKRRKNLFARLAHTVVDMLDYPDAAMLERRTRVTGDFKDLGLCQHALVRGGLADWIRKPGSARDHCALTGLAEHKLRAVGAEQIFAWAMEEHDRQFGSVSAPVYSGPHRIAAPVVTKPGWPKDLPCPRCRQMHKATWEGDRYHPHCRRQAFEQASEVDTYSMGSMSGNRRAGRRA